MQTLKIENLGNAKSTTKTLESKQIASIYGGLPRNGSFGTDGRVIDSATGRFTGEVIGNPNSLGIRGIFAGGEAVAAIAGNGAVIRGGRDTGFDVTVRRNRLSRREVGGGTISFNG